MTCIGEGDKEGRCGEQTGRSSGLGRKNPYWCPECDEVRIERIGGELEALVENFQKAN